MCSRSFARGVSLGLSLPLLLLVSPSVCVHFFDLISGAPFLGPFISRPLAAAATTGHAHTHIHIYTHREKSSSVVRPARLTRKHFRIFLCVYLTHTLTRPLPPSQRARFSFFKQQPGSDRVDDGH